MMTRAQWLRALVFLLAPALPLWKTVLGGQAIGPFDQIREMSPWHGHPTSAPWDVLQADGVLQFVPWRDLVFEAWSKLQLPLWNNYELAGTPLLANSQSAALYPPHILAGLLHLPTLPAMVLLAWIHLSWAAVGTHRLIRSLGGSVNGALIGGLSYSLSPFMLAWTALPSVITTVSWIPWCLWAAHGALAGKPSPAVLRPVGVLGACVGMMLLAGHLQFAFYGLLAVALFAAIDIIGRRRHFASGGLVLAGLVLGAAAAGAQLLPVTQFAKQSNRQNKPDEVGYASYAKAAIQPFEWAGVLNPVALGFPRDAVGEPPQTLSTYWPPLVKQGANYAESAICIGPVVLALLGLTPWRDRRSWSIAGMAAVMLLLCVGSALNRILYFGLPGWSASGSPGRCVVVFVLGACVLAGLGVPEPGRSEQRRAWRLPSVLLVLGVLVSLYGAIAAPAAPERAAKVLDTLQGAASGKALATLLLCAALGAISIVVFTNERFRAARRAAVLLPLAFSACTVGLFLVPTGTGLPTVKKPPDGERVAYINSGWNLFQVPSATMPPNLASLSRVHELGGYDSLLDASTVAMLATVDGENPAPLENGNMMLIKRADSEALASAGVTWVDRDGNFQHLPGATGRVSLPGGVAKIVSEDFSSLTVEATGAGLLTVRDRLMPGWSATVDGARAAMQSGTWRVVSLPQSGRHLIRFVYEPPGLVSGFIVSALGFGGIGFCLILAGPLRKRVSPVRVE